MTRTEELWKYLNEYGIYTMDDFEKACKENVFYIGMFTIPSKEEQ